jgi:adenine/guanine phosphoribosyltransferase-like PRPP-binding protein
VLAPFDRLVIATGARHRLGLGTIAANLLDWGAARSRPFSQLFSAPMFRDWFYYKGRRATGDYFRQFAKPGQMVIVIGDAVRAGKSKEAIASAFEAALLPCAPS